MLEWEKQKRVLTNVLVLSQIRNRDPNQYSFFHPQVTEELTKDAQQKQESAAIIHAYQLMLLHAAQASALFKVMSKYYKRLLLDKADVQEPFD